MKIERKKKHHLLVLYEFIKEILLVRKLLLGEKGILNSFIDSIIR
jgi:hypothetical protein